MSLYGMDGTLGLSFQDSYGTAQVASLHWLPIISENITLKRPPIRSANMLGRFDQSKAFEGPNTNEGDIDSEIDVVSIGALLKATLGDPTTVTSGSLKTHTFKPSTSDFDDFAANRPCTILKYFNDSGGSAHQYYDMVGNMIELSFANGEFVKGKASFMGGKYAGLAAVAASYPTNDLITWDTSSIVVAGAVNVDFGSLTVKVEQPMEAKHTLDGTKTPNRIKRSDRRIVSVEGTMLFTNQAEFTVFKAYTEQTLVMYFQNATQPQSGYNESIKIDLPSLRYDTFEPALNAAGLLEVSVSAIGEYNTGSATAIEITLINTHAGW